MREVRFWCDADLLQFLGICEKSRLKSSPASNWFAARKSSMGTACIS